MRLAQLRPQVLTHLKSAIYQHPIMAHDTLSKLNRLNWSLRPLTVSLTLSVFISAGLTHADYPSFYSPNQPLMLFEDHFIEKNVRQCWEIGTT